MRKKRIIVISSVAVACTAIGIAFRVLAPSIEVHGSLSASDLVQIQHLVRNHQRALLFPLSMSAVRQRFFQPIQCIYVLPDDRVQVDCRLHKHAYDGYFHHYEFTRDSREPSGWRWTGGGAGNRGVGRL